MQSVFQRPNHRSIDVMGDHVIDGAAHIFCIIYKISVHIRYIFLQFTLWTHPTIPAPIHLRRIRCHTADPSGSSKISPGSDIR